MLAILNHQHDCMVIWLIANNSVNREFLIEKGHASAIDAFEAEVVKQENIIAIGNRYSLENLAINTEHSEFGMVPHNDFLVYAAARKQLRKKNIFSGYYGWNDQPFLDIYKIHKDSISKGNTASKSISTDRTNYPFKTV